MGLWIRSQDKHNLVKVNNLSASYDFDYNDNKYHYTIQEHEYGTALGYYETKERALEVLDEIQNILKPKYILNASSIKQNGDYYEKNGEIYQDYSADARIEQLNIYVYEMPEE